MFKTLGVLCSETTNPVDPTLAIGAAQAADAIVPGEGTVRTWQGAACIQWPFRGENAYRGFYDAKPANGVMILSNEFDTATPYERGAVALRNTLKGSRLVTVQKGYGHGAAHESSCARKHLETYILKAKLPDTDQVCTQDKPPFPTH